MIRIGRRKRRHALTVLCLLFLKAAMVCRIAGIRETG